MIQIDSEGSTKACVSSSMTMAGAKLQHPRHLTASEENFRSVVIPPIEDRNERPVLNLHGSSLYFHLALAENFTPSMSEDVVLSSSKDQ
jgi:hypothetical protein